MACPSASTLPLSKTNRFRLALLLLLLICPLSAAQVSALSALSLRQLRCAMAARAEEDLGEAQLGRGCPELLDPSCLRRQRRSKHLPSSQRERRRKDGEEGQEGGET